MSYTWNLWHGCHKKSEGCLNCYVYRGDEKYDRDSSLVFKTKDFYMPIKKDRKGEYKIKSGEIVYTCFTSDFLLEDCDEWRKEAWDMIRTRKDLYFFFITKRIERLKEVAPSDFDSMTNVGIGCTCENQKRADERLPTFISLKLGYKAIICEPLLEEIDLSKYLSRIDEVICGGESGFEARPCNYNWILKIRQECIKNNVVFVFKQTGRKLIKDGKLYLIPRKLQHVQARKANINVGKPFFMLHN